jgi:AraC family transcriptional regulator
MADISELPGAELPRHSQTGKLALPDLRDGREYSARLLRAVLDYVEDCPHQLLSLSELASVAGISRFHFSRPFRESMGISPIKYVERSRLEAARRMIVSGRQTLSQIAIATGFADQSHFTRRFKRHFAMTPAQFAVLHAPHIVRMKSLDT